MAKLWRLALGVTGAVILWLALRPAGHEPDWFWQADKVKHASAFLVLWGLGRLGRWGLPAHWGWGLLAFGVFIEFAQSFTPDREVSALDVLADAVGIGLGWALTRHPRVSAWIARLSPPAT